MTDFYKLGPQKTTVEISMGNFGSNLLIETLKKLAIQGKVSEPYYPHRSVKARTVRKIKITFETDWAPKSFLKEVNRIFKEGLFEIKEHAEPLFSNNWEYFEYELATMDWHYAYSDDHSVWRAGESKMARLKEMGKELKSLDKNQFEATLNRVRNQYNKDFLTMF